MPAGIGLLEHDLDATRLWFNLKLVAEVGLQGSRHISVETVIEVCDVVELDARARRRQDTGQEFHIRDHRPERHGGRCPRDDQGEGQVGLLRELEVRLYGKRL